MPSMRISVYSYGAMIPDAPSKRPSSAYCMASLAPGTWHFCEPQQTKKCIVKGGRALTRPHRFDELLMTVVLWNVPGSRLK